MADIDLVEINKYFGSHNGFGEYKQVAHDLLKRVTEVLDENKINYFLISGTLLGYIRHNDFIPWDDDIDLIVDNSIFDKLDALIEKYKDLSFITRDGYIVKTSFRDVGKKLDGFEHYKIRDDEVYKFPFVDLFIYNCHDDQINFLEKNGI